MTALRTESVPRLDTLLLAIIAAGALAVARIESAWHPGPVVARIVCEIVAMVGLWALVRNWAAAREQGRRYCTLSLVVAVGFPFAYECGQRWLGQTGAPAEMTMLISFQLAALVLAVFSFLPRLGGTSVVLSSFLLLFSTTMTTNRVAYVVAGAYGVLGLWWLMGAYWDRIEGAFVASSVERRIPVRASVIGVTGLVLLLVSGLVGATGTSAVVLRGFMPTSGGNHWHDPYSRSGVGDGDAMVAAKDEALSFGPVESELFLDSEMPSLYDMFDDMYGEPPRPTRKQQRAIAVASQDREETEQQTAKTQRSGREFSTVRRRAQRKRKELSDRDAPAMLYVVGRTPLHLGLETYDFFDGREWAHRSGWAEATPPKLHKHFGKPWITFRQDAHASIFRGENCHAIKVINLKTNRVAAPPHLTELHIDLLDRINFFDWTKDGMLQMSDRDRIPQLTVIHLHSRGINLHPLRGDYDFSQLYAEDETSKLRPHLQHRERYEGIASSWVEDVPRGWLQVETIVDRLRRDFVHAPDSPAAEDCKDVVAHFLEVHEGPDYLFATTAATLLRSLGYPTRLVTGFYVNPERYDYRAGQTSVLSQDVHVWAEVCVDGRNWVTIEPTPGYHPPVENLTWKQWASLAFRQWINWCQRQVIGLSAFAMVVVVLAAWRHVWLDLIGLGVCRLLGLRSSRARLLWTIRLLEWRAWLAGRARPRQKTIVAWYSPLLDSASDELQPALRCFLRLSDRLLYSPHALQPNQHEETRRGCAAVVTASKRRSIVSSIAAPSSNAT